MFTNTKSVIIFKMENFIDLRIYQTTVTPMKLFVFFIDYSTITKYWKLQYDRAQFFFIFSSLCKILSHIIIVAN